MGYELLYILGSMFGIGEVIPELCLWMDSYNICCDFLYCIFVVARTLHDDIVHLWLWQFTETVLGPNSTEIVFLLEWSSNYWIYSMFKTVIL